MNWIIKLVWFSYAIFKKPGCSTLYLLFLKSPMKANPALIGNGLKNKFSSLGSLWYNGKRKIIDNGTHHKAVR